MGAVKAQGRGYQSCSASTCVILTQYSQRLKDPRPGGLLPSLEQIPPQYLCDHPNSSTPDNPQHSSLLHFPRSCIDPSPGLILLSAGIFEFFEQLGSQDHLQRIRADTVEPKPEHLHQLSDFPFDQVSRGPTGIPELVAILQNRVRISDKGSHASSVTGRVSSRQDLRL